ncbi:MAG: DUF115 domain-containing protein [Proteobacteria bacterium]|nr:DUF115 domain-containing protein [Pseudomonadota bacterium]
MGVSEKTVYENNISLLKKNHPLAWGALSMAKKPDKMESSHEIELVFTDNGRPNLLVKGARGDTVLIHDGEEPGRESDSFLSMIGQDSTGGALVFGMGLGYLPLELLKQKKKLQYILVFELEPEYFRIALEQMDLTSLLDDKRVILAIGYPENVAGLLRPVKRALMLEDIHTHKFLTCFELNSDYEKLSSAVFNLVSEYNIEGATQSLHGKTFVENRLKHLTSMPHDNRLEELAEKFKGVPALIVAAGPSLDKNIQEIKRAVGKAVIISVDTALPALLKQGIKPDFITSIDYNSPTYEKIADMALDPRSREISLICTSWVAATVSKTFPAKTIFWAFGGTAFENWINHALGGSMSIGGAGTVAHLNFLSAKILGCDPVIFVGQDLAYSYSKEHASEVVFTGTETMEKILKDAVWVKGVTEAKVPTTRGMHGYRLLFEEWIETTEGRVINATEGGAWIEGAEHMPLSEAIDLFCSHDICLDIESGGNRIDPSKAMVSMLKKVEQAEKMIKKTGRLADKVIGEVSKLKGKNRKITCLNMLPHKLYKQILTLDSYYNEADKNRLWHMFDEMTMEGLRQNEREINEIERLEGVPEKYLEWLSKSVKRTDRVNGIRQKNLDEFKGKLNFLISFYADEKRLLGRVDNGRMDLADVLSLAEIYFQNGDYTLLDNFLNTYAREESSALYYYRGVISLYRRAYENAEKFFDQALTLDDTFKEKIDAKRREMAEYYYDWALTVPFNSLSDLESQSGIYMRLKGLKCFSGHALLTDGFWELAKKDLEKVLQNVQEGGAEARSFNKETLRAWVGLLIKADPIHQCIPRDVQVAFFRHYGKILLDEKKFDKVFENYKSALSLMPDMPELYVALTDLCFSMEKFDEGFQYLRTAVSLDRNYAVYWNNIGDNLQARGDFKGAIISYENYFTAFPKKIESLKKICDCHLNLGNMEAAEDAQRQFENLKGNVGRNS